MKFGTDMDPTKKLSHTKISMHVPVRYDHSKVYFKISSRIFNKLTITWLVIITEPFCLDFWNAH